MFSVARLVTASTLWLATNYVNSKRHHRDLPHVPLLRVGLGDGRADGVRAPVVLVAEVKDDAILACLRGRRAVLVLEGVELVEDGRGALGNADEVVVVRLADDVA